MFFKSKKENTEEVADKNNSDDFLEKLSREMKTHNMPAHDKIAGEIINPSAPGKVSFESRPEQSGNSKMIGAVIIVGGLLMISLIVFLVYKFVISPTAKRTEVAPVNNQSAQEKVEEKTDVKESVEINEELSQVAESDNVSIIATSSTEIISPETEDLSEDDNEVAPILDSDSDGLSDEEELLLGTSKDLEDSDGDGYSDLAELLSFYDPLVKGASMKNSDNFLSYNSSVYGFNFLYPKSMALTELRSDFISLVADDGSLVQASVMSNDEGLGILTWFGQNLPNEKIDINNFISGKGFEAIKSEDGLYFYVSDEKRSFILTISYLPLDANRLVYKNIFNFITASLSF